MMNRAELTMEELELVNGGRELDIEVDRDDNPFTLLYKTAKSDAAKEICKEMWEGAKNYANELGQRALGTAVLTTVNAWEKIKRWF